MQTGDPTPRVGGPRRRAAGAAFVYALLVSAPAPAGWPDVDALPPSSGYPDPLVMFDGSPVTSAEHWREQRRPELIALFEHYMYGKAPPPPPDLRFAVDHVDKAALGGKATRKLVTLRFGPEGTPPVSLLLVVPNRRPGPAPVFVGLNFAGNHTVMHDPAIPLTRAWVNDQWSGGNDGRAHDDQRGIRAPGGNRPRWWIERAVERGYAVATLYAGEISPDRADGDHAFTDGVHRAYFAPGQTRPGPHEWATIAAWAWGLQRAADYLVQDGAIDPHRLIAVGHSRLGKTALLAAAFDERFALVIPSQAGCGGTAPSRTEFGETVERINRSFPHWFTDTFKRFGGQVDRLPFDQHALIALVAPRPVLLTNASDDTWANPRGQFDMLLAAAPVYRLLGVPNPVAPAAFPAENVLVDSRLGYFIRPGGHDMGQTEWDAWLAFADKHLPDP